MKCILDLDGVLVDFIGGAAHFHGRPEPLEYEGEIWEDFHMKPEAFWRFGFDFWSNLQWLPDGPYILGFLEGFFRPENICICTSPTLNPQAAAGKMAWIQKNLPDYSRQFLIGPAKHFCSGCLIDDSERNIQKFEGLGILVPRPWNSLRGKNAKNYIISMLESYSENNLL